MSDELSRVLGPRAVKTEGETKILLKTADDGTTVSVRRKSCAAVPTAVRDECLITQSEDCYQEVELSLLRDQNTSLLTKIHNLELKQNDPKRMFWWLWPLAAVLLLGIGVAVFAPWSDYKSCASLKREYHDIANFISLRGPVREDPGNCWSDGPPFTPEICCSPWYGKSGHAGCWTSDMNYTRCCTTHWM